ncbi:MAG: STAS-like domain-containing protein [Parcubacteria group bacterium]|nr:STAS-like domain-containing protein [Parcubacteria group bacterium]
MTIFLKKFGTTLSSRQLGREALAAFKPSLKGVKDGEKVVVDFEGVMVFTPSWGDEFLTPLLDKFGKHLVLKNTENLSVQATLKLLEKIHKVNFITIS